MMRVLGLLSSLLLTACFGGGAVVPEDRFYRLAEPAAPSPRNIPFVDVLAVATLQSDPLLRERAVLYSETTAPLTIRRYHYHYWTHVPGQLIQQQLLDYLRNAGVATQVVRYGEQPRTAARVSGYLKRFERVVGAGHPHVAVALELHYQTEAADKPVIMQEYHENETAQDASMQATVAAFSRALQRIYAAFLADLNSASH